MIRKSFLKEVAAFVLCVAVLAYLWIKTPIPWPVSLALCVILFALLLALIGGKSKSQVILQSELREEASMLREVRTLIEKLGDYAESLRTSELQIALNAICRDGSLIVEKLSSDEFASLSEVQAVLNLLTRLDTILTGYVSAVTGDIRIDEQLFSTTTEETEKIIPAFMDAFDKIVVEIDSADAQAYRAAILAARMQLEVRFGEDLTRKE
ncbi:hypothetical protein A3D01_02340 [Candidatus Woesebacteria bacterium RIFCSPHIGHO2_02_FULL_39_13]|uniref:Uncharacterized protein n=1 Tax=Candidatus Woesebacteria bacterium RIFCSPHIGHO2_02_FULL_39_13 TaxID=1802505 RepID=A0A1F7Z2B1_9BACT|nr:MAG: hypothetical protein A3D01_02340 [Candidatus Woesebacteria bacterium RIFCSPHIGHO2_02_FULL_39_13]OGM37577.1 MAG: hypothetical protein A3E13_01345 [Candidatus Woesebacteria bacterium RIFCSPHIGHO2_12_FULL_40_20]OGM72529.1 MAG: hypothetical protein A3H19_01130 [Candidatus Woesebacteria bacterium RIFCSPLOWO2_12_FULL_39_9]